MSAPFLPLPDFFKHLPGIYNYEPGKSIVALLGAVTNNLRAVTVSTLENEIIQYFYYEHQPNNEEIEISAIVASEVISDFIQVSLQVKHAGFTFTIKSPYFIKWGKKTKKPHRARRLCAAS